MNSIKSITGRFVKAAVTILFAGFMTAPSQADIITFKDGFTNVFSGGVAYTNTQDAGLFATSPDGNFGGEVFWDVGDGSDQFGGVRRGLVRFDVSSLSNQYTQINSISLKLYLGDRTDIFGVNSNTNTLQVFQISSANAAWVEGTSSGGQQAGSPSWNNRVDPSGPWAGSAGLSTPGTDYNTLWASANWDISTGVNNTNSPLVLSFTGSSAALTSLIDSWVTPGGNSGLFIRATDEPGGLGFYRLIRLHSADASNTALRPELEIDFVAIPEPTTALLALGGALLLWRRRARG